MSTIDLSRLATDPRKHYAGVRMQQGRVLTDDDFNEAANLQAEDMRRTRLHAIGAYGSPDGGFLPKNLAAVAGKLDFQLSNGHLYLGGLALHMGSEDHFLEQKDWLNFNQAVDAPAAPAAGSSRVDMVWIEAWQQPVTAVEDAELFEVALGGPDTSTRWRSMRRVQVATGVAADECAEAWATVSAGFAALGAMNAEMELATSATLSVTFSQPASAGDLCSPPQPGGYLGAENQAIRVQMVDATHFTWGYDNAAPLYRAQVTAANGQLVKVKLLTAPKDAVHWPLGEQVVEILPWSAALANGQRVAELRGHLSKVAVSYDPDTGLLELQTPLPANFGSQWKARSDRASFNDAADADDEFFFLRVWNRGEDLASPAAIALPNPAAPVALGQTGLQVQFSGGPLRAADHWIIAARPAAPDAIVPWQLSLPSGAAPAGVRCYRAPLALLKWTTAANGAVSGSVLHDCRPPFLPLTRMRNCCSVTVGDGNASFGHFQSINAAIQALPASGGTVCILPGRYEEAVLIQGRRNITLHGCGPRSRIVAPGQQGAASIAVAITESRDIAIEGLALEGGAGAVLQAQEVLALRVADCLVQFRDLRQGASVWPALFIDGQEVEILDNIIEPLPRELPLGLQRIFHQTAEAERAEEADGARGGIQLAGGCEQVLIEGNLIVGGAGNGITLGSILRFDEQHPNGHRAPDIDEPDPCAPCDPVRVEPPAGGNTDTRYESAGDLYDIEIRANHITRHGANGIAVVRYFGLDLKGGGGLPLVCVHGLGIHDNRIVRCLRREVATSQSALRLFLGYGGIALALVTDLDVSGNLIALNGRSWLSPVCGLFVLVADGLNVEHNRIHGNGLRNGEDLDSAQPGIRAGVHVWLAMSLPGAVGGAVGHSLAKLDGGGERGMEQLRVHANHIEQPLGRALFMLGAGPMAVSDNRLLSQGVGAVTGPVADAALVLNLGVSKEWTLGLIMTLVYSILLKAFKLAAGNAAYEAVLCAYSKYSKFMPALWPDRPCGKIQFHDNQVSFVMEDAAPGLDFSSVLLASLDDVSAQANQLEHHTQRRLVLGDLLALGVTVRSSDNRLAETWGRALNSILSVGLMNTAADNQATHCIRALGLQRAVHHNLVLAEAFCKDACSNPSGLFGHIAVAAMAAKPGP